MKLLMMLAGVVFCSFSVAAERPRIDLNGRWDFRLDPLDQGDADNWYRRQTEFRDSIQVPGSWQAQGVGSPQGILKNHYAGTAWYRKRVVVPAQWEGKAIQLSIGGAHRRTRLFVNGIPIGEEYDGFSAPFSFDVTSAIRPGEENIFVLRINNSGPVVSTGPREQTAELPVGMFNYVTNWGGIHGNVELLATDPLRIESVYVITEVDPNSARFHLLVTNENREAYTVQIRASVRGESPAESSLTIAPGDSENLELKVPMPAAQLWSPEHPELHTAVLSIFHQGRELDRVEQRFGLREFSTHGNTLLLNGKPLYLCGFGDDNIEVLGGVAPASREAHLDRLRLARSFGFNAVRFHSMTPSAGFFEAADEAGILVMAELPVAYTQYFLPHREFLRRELKAVLIAYRNHPSLLSLAFGNEFNLRWLKSDEEREAFRQLVAEFYEAAKSLAPASLIMSNDGFILKPTDLASIGRGSSDELPVVRHEFGGYYCSLPDISLIDRFTGALRPTWLEAKKDWVEESGLVDSYGTYLRNSHRLQQLGRKFQIERVRRDPGVTGYHYWLIVDFPGGTGEGDSWEEGWFNYFWEPKDIQPAEGREINNPVLLMLGADVDDRTLWSDSRKKVEIYLSNYGDKPIMDGVLRWSVAAGGQKLTGAEKSGIQVPLGKVESLGELFIGPLNVEKAQKVTLQVELESGNRVERNRWNFWCFPRNGLVSETAIPVFSQVRRAAIKRLYPFVVAEGLPKPGSLLVTSSLNSEAVSFLREGGRVMVLAGRGQSSRSEGGRFFPASGGAYGTVIEEHPALQGFPHEGFCDLQFFNLLEGSWNLSLDRWPRELKPVVGAVRTTTSFLSEKKELSRIGYLLEARVGKGRLLISTLRLQELFDEAFPEVIYFFDNLLRYATSADFRPEVVISEDQLSQLTR